MNNWYFVRKKLLNLSITLCVVVLKLLLRGYKTIFTKRTILFVTNQKIRTVSFGPLAQLCLIGFVIWISNVFIQSTKFNQIIDSKTAEVEHLKIVNGYFEEQFNAMNDKLRKVNQYLIATTGKDHLVKMQLESPKAMPRGLKENKLNEQDKETFNQLKDANQQLSDMQSIARNRIKKIENVIAITGLSIKKTIPASSLKEKVARITSAALGKIHQPNQGGPLLEDDSLEAAFNTKVLSNESLESRLDRSQFAGEIDYLIVLEKLAEAIPLSQPMKNYYISSGFGSRSDPLTGKHASHQGLDFVGSSKEKVISPSSGKVVLAGKFSDYGNAIVIDHGFGITTRYGHLAEVRVKEGQMVKKGDVVALQGNSGRSTGAHLHYEVRYKNTPLNPKKFLEAGQALFNDSRVIRHANS